MNEYFDDWDWDYYFNDYNFESFGQTILCSWPDFKQNLPSISLNVSFTVNILNIQHINEEKQFLTIYMEIVSYWKENNLGIQGDSDS